MKDTSIVVSGPAGTGKTLGLLQKLHHMAMVNPGMRGVILRKTLVSLTASALVTWNEQVIKPLAEQGLISYFGGNMVEPAQYRYWNGSKIMVGGMDKPSKVLSTEYDIIVVVQAEELFEKDYQALITRLRHNKMSFQQILMDCNPDSPHHWIKKQADDGNLTMVHSRHEDNPRYWNPEEQAWTKEGQEYIARLEMLTGVYYKRLRKGEWVGAEGLIYDEFDSAIHLVDSFEIPKTWTRYMSVDFGYVNPFVAQWWAEDEDGRLYLYREYVRTEALVEDHALVINALNEGEPNPRLIICDHDAEGRATLKKHLKRGTRAANKAVQEGIQEMQSRLKMQGDGKPRLMIFRDALVDRDKSMVDAYQPIGLAEEIVGYTWATSPEGKPAKEEPNKVNDHSMDAARYICAEFMRKTGKKASLKSAVDEWR